MRDRKIAPVNALIWDIRRYSLHDGPGIRTTVFFKGCPLGCLWCCNPESQSHRPELVWIRSRCLACDLCRQICARRAVILHPDGIRRVDFDRCDLCGRCAEKCPGEALNLMGRPMTVDQVLAEVSKDATFYQRSGGGLTLSGGEPLAQAGFAAELLRRYKLEEGGSSTAVETCGHADWDSVRKVARHTDLFLFDLKHMDPERHFELTGVPNHLILDNLTRLAREGAAINIRFPLITNINDSLDNIESMAQFIAELHDVTHLDILPYHRLGQPKYARLDREYELSELQSPSPERVAEIKKVCETHGLEVRIGG